MSNAFFAKNGHTADDYADRYPHGTRARYHLGKCHCLPCAAANSEYESARRRAILGPWRCSKQGRTTRWHVRNVDTGEVDLRTEVRAIALKRMRLLNKRDAEPAENQLVDPKRAIAHMAKLQAAGVGLKTVSKASCVAYSVLCRIMAGDIKRSRRSTIDAILGVTIDAARGRSKIDGAATWALLDDLLARGWTKGWIAQQLGSKTPALQIKRQKVSGETARRVRELHRRLEGCHPAARALGTRWAYTPPAGARTPDDPPQIREERRSRLQQSPEFMRRLDQVFRDLGAGVL